MSIDPKNLDKIFSDPIFVGSGFEPSINEAKVVDLVFASSEPVLQVFDSKIAEAAAKRIDIATAHLVNDRKNYFSFDEKFRQASKVARNIKIYADLDQIDKSKNLIELGFTIESINKIMNYARQSLALNYRSTTEFDEFSKKPVSELESTIESLVTRNFLKHFFAEEFFSNDYSMAYFKLVVDGDELLFTDRKFTSPTPLMNVNAFKNKIAEYFSLDDFRIKDLFSQDGEVLSFLELAEQIKEIQSIKTLD
jgi:DNA-binding transcriptional MerR regulator